MNGDQTVYDYMQPKMAEIATMKAAVPLLQAR
jgi:hypothetical protein